MAKTTKTTKTTNTESQNNASASLKTFKASNEVENFYRFIAENNLRAEAKTLVEMVLKRIKPAKKRGRKKTTLH